MENGPSASDKNEITAANGQFRPGLLIFLHNSILWDIFSRDFPKITFASRKKGEKNPSVYELSIRRDVNSLITAC